MIIQNDLEQKLESERLTYTPITQEGITKIKQVVQNEDMENINKYLVKPINYEGIETAEQVIQERLEHLPPEYVHMTYIIRRKQDNQIIGECNITLDTFNQTANLGVWIREKHWGNGYATERGKTLTNFLLNELEINKINVATHKDNQKARKMIEKYTKEHNAQYQGIKLQQILDKALLTHVFTITNQKPAKQTQ